MPVRSCEWQQELVAIECNAVCICIMHCTYVTSVEEGDSVSALHLSGMGGV